MSCDAYLDLIVAGAVSVHIRLWLAHAPFTDDQSALSSPGGAAFQIDFPYHKLAEPHVVGSNEVWYSTTQLWVLAPDFGERVTRSNINFGGRSRC
jgi:hypothetical protein